MGNQFCCRSQCENDILSSTKIMLQLYERSKKCLSLLCYNIDEDRASSLSVNLRVLNSLKGISQVNSEDGFIYLCGNNEDTIKTNLIHGAYLIKLHLIEKRVETNFLINSRCPHYNPSLIINNKLILVIGGKGQIKCELYNLELNKWKEVRNLPEERYKCSLIIDRNEEFLYLFGGISNKNNKIEANYTILRLVVKNILYQWERIMINENFNLLNRYSSACFKTNNSNFIYILGGKSVEKEQKELSDVVIYDCFCRIVKNSNIKLKNKSCFVNKTGININKNQFFFIDKNCNVHLINSATKNSEIKNLKENSFL